MAVKTAWDPLCRIPRLLASLPDALCGRSSKLWSTTPVVLNNFTQFLLRNISTSLLEFWPLSSFGSASTSYAVVCGPLGVLQRTSSCYLRNKSFLRTWSNVCQKLGHPGSRIMQRQLANRKGVRPLMCSDLLDSSAKLYLLFNSLYASACQLRICSLSLRVLVKRVSFMMLIPD
jgi:hypothetical protein